MDHLADSIAKLSQGRENWYKGREGFPVDDRSGEICEPVIVFECMDYVYRPKIECVWVVLCFKQFCICVCQVLQTPLKSITWSAYLCANDGFKT